MPTGLSLNEEDLRSILNGMVDGIITINDKGIILSFNKSAETIFGFKNKEVVGKNVSILMPEPNNRRHDKFLKRYISTGKAHIIGIGRDVIALKKDGTQFPMRLSVVEYPSKVEGERWFIGSCLDITHYKAKEEQLERSMKMEALGNLISGVAHDYNNMLAIILGYSDIIKKNYKNDSALLKYISKIKYAGERNRDLTNSLLSLSRHHPSSNENVFINDILNNEFEMLTQLLTANIKLSMKLDNNLWIVSINKGAFEDTILNLSINAMHAMPKGGTLEFSTSNVEVSTLEAQILNISAGQYVKVAITDTGIGMTKEVASHIFEPFFTTKDKKGTGLGLSQVYGFVDKSNGAIQVRSEPDKGACFWIFLPRSLNEDNKIETNIVEEAAENKSVDGNGKVLVVDDESILQELMEIMLTEHGYDVILASGGKQALSILKRNM